MSDCMGRQLAVAMLPVAVIVQRNTSCPEVHSHSVPGRPHWLKSEILGPVHTTSTNVG